MQKLLLALYSRLRSTGFLDSPWAKMLFARAYFVYKRHLEDPFHLLVNEHPELLQGGHILDIGANIGYSAVLFSRAIDPGFRVFSFEPESSNCEILKLVLARHGLEGRVQVTRAMVGRSPGVGRIWVNQDHHGDHRVMTEALRQALGNSEDIVSEEVPTVSVDHFVEENGLGPIPFAKIDVQGYEPEVCAGMERTLELNPGMCVALEYSPQQSRDLGLDPEAAIRFFEDRSYRLYALERRAPLRLLTREAREALVTKRGYSDILVSRKTLV